MQRIQAKNGIAMTVAACLWLGLFPLLQRFSYARITLDKWLFMLALCGVTLLCCLIDIICRFTAARRDGNRMPIRSGPLPLLPLILGGLLLLWVVLSCLLSPYEADIWWIGASMRREGLATQLCYLVIFFCFIFGRIRLKPVLMAACGGVVLFAVVVLLQRHGGNPLGLYPAGRSYALNPEFQGTIGNIDMDTGYLCLLSGFFLYGGIRQFRVYRQNPSRSALATIICCSVGFGISVFLILTMQVQFGVITLSALLLFTLLRLLPKKGRLAAFLLVLVLVLLVAWFWPGTGGGLWELHEILHGRLRLSFGSNRVAVWLWSLQLAREQLVFGSGSDTFVLRFNQYLRDHGLTVPNEQDGVTLPAYFDNPHNEYLSQFLNHGLPAMLLLILLIAASVMRKQEGLFPLLSPCSAAVLCYAVQAFFSFPVCLVSPMFWALLGISFQLDQNY